MAIPVTTFQPLSFEQNNPLLSGIMMGNKLYQQGIENAYAPRMYESQLKTSDLANALKEVELKYADPMAKAGLAYQQQLAPHMQAQTGLLNKQIQWYDPNIQSEIGARNAAAALNSQQAKFYGPHMQAVIEQMQLENALKKQFPLLGQTGAAGQIGALQYLQKMEQSNGARQPQAQQQMLPPSQPIDISALSKTVNPLQIGLSNFSSASPQLASAIGRQMSNFQGNASQNMGSNQPQQTVLAPMNGEMPISQDSLADLLRGNIFADLKKKRAATDLIQKQASGYEWSKLPSGEKKFSLGQARAMGYDLDEANRLLATGRSIKDLALAKGFDPNNLPASEPIPTNAVLTRQQRANAVIAGLNKIEPMIEQAYAPYGMRIGGLSPELILDLIRGKNKKEAGRILGAWSAAPEVMGARINAFGGNVGHGAIQSMQDQSMLRLNTLHLSPDSETLMEAQRYLNTLINTMNEEENKVIFGANRMRAPERNSENEESATLSDSDILKLAAGE